MAEAALAMRDVMSREEEPSFVINVLRLKEENPKITFRETVLEKVRPVESVQEWWEEHDDFDNMTRGVEH